MSNRKRVSPKESMSAAKENIEAKVELLEHWISHGIPSRQSDCGAYLVDDYGNPLPIHAPTSIRQFNSWDLKVLPQVSVKTNSASDALVPNGNNTLLKHPNLHARAKAAVATISRQIKAGRVDKTKHGQKRLKDKVRQLELVVENMTATITAQQRSILQLRADLEGSRLRHQSRLKSCEDTIHEAHQELESLRRKHADALAKLSTLRPLRNAID